MKSILKAPIFALASVVGLILVLGLPTAAAADASPPSHATDGGSDCGYAVIGLNCDYVGPDGKTYRCTLFVRFGTLYVGCVAKT